MRTLAPASIPHVNEVTLDLPALGFAFASSLAAGIVVGAIAVFALPKNRSLSVTAASREREGIPLRRALVAVQIAVSLVLVSLAGLLIESFEHLQQLTYGVQSEHVLIADISLGFKRYSNAVVRQEFLDRLLERLRVIPGTSGVAFSDTVPPSGFVHDRPLRNFIVNGRRVETNGMGVMIAWRSVTPDYLRVLGIELLAGRNFSESDRASGEDLILLSRSLARVLFSGSNAVDSHLKVSPDSPIYRVVGIAADVRNSGTSSGQLPEYYLLRKKIVDPRMGRDANIMSRSLHFYDGQGSILVRTAGRPDLVAAAIRHELRELDPATPLTVSTLDSHIAELRRAPRFRMLLVSAFATLSLLLAATGLYGAITYLVTQRTREIGVRVAIGATPPQVAGLVLGQALRWSLAGLIPGLLLSFAAAHWFRSLLFDTPAHDPKLFVVAVLVLLLATLAASTVPSIRASRLDAVEALRQD